jgi:hypothetical protein
VKYFFDTSVLVAAILLTTSITQPAKLHIFPPPKTIQVALPTVWLTFMQRSPGFLESDA